MRAANNGFGSSKGWRTFSSFASGASVFSADSRGYATNFYNKSCRMAARCLVLGFSSSTSREAH